MDSVTVLTSIVTPIVIAALTSFAGYFIQERKLRRDFDLDRERLRTEFMAEQAAKSLLENERWTKRSFDEIRKRLGGFEDNELRKVLVRAGAVRFESSEGNEFWGLVSRNEAEV